MPPWTHSETQPCTAIDPLRIPATCCHRPIHPYRHCSFANPNLVNHQNHNPPPTSSPKPTPLPTSPKPILKFSSCRHKSSKRGYGPTQNFSNLSVEPLMKRERERERERQGSGKLWDKERIYLIIAVCKFSDSDEGKSIHLNFLSGQQLCGWAHRSHARHVSNISVQINSNLNEEGNGHAIESN